LGIDSDEIKKPIQILKHKKLCSVFLVFEIIILLIMPIPFYDTYVAGETFDTNLSTNVD